MVKPRLPKSKINRCPPASKQKSLEAGDLIFACVLGAAWQANAKAFAFGSAGGIITLFNVDFEKAGVLDGTDKDCVF